MQFWLQGWKTTVIFMIAVVTASTAALWLLHRADSTPEHLDWPTTPARIVGLRITTFMPLSSRTPFVRYDAEYKLRYEVNGKLYETWASGLSRLTRTAVTNDAEDDMQSAIYVVRYNPKHPSQAEAKRQ